MSVTFRHDMRVDLVDFMGGDDRVAQAARVSTKGSGSDRETAQPGFIDFLVRNRHSVPFEHSVFTFRIECPIFVSREIVKHRLTSISEISGRYTILPSDFYVPAGDRPLVQVGKTGDYRFEQGSAEQREMTRRRMESAATYAHGDYCDLLDAGIAKEVARMVLPVSTYTSMVVTLNARSLTNFLSLRVRDESAAVPSFAMSEIDQVAREMEEHFRDQMPLTCNAWLDNGRRPL